MAPAEKTGKFSRQKKIKHKSHRKELKTGGWKTKEKDEDSRRKTLHYGRFKFTATNKARLAPGAKPPFDPNARFDYG